MTDEALDGHLVEGCEGDWIDVSTFQKREWVCSKCRGSVTAPPPDKIEPPDFPEPEPEAPVASRSGIPWRWIALATAVGAGMALAVALGLRPG